MTKEQTPQDANEGTIGAVASAAELGAPRRYVVVRDMNYTGEVMAGEWDVQFYVLADGDCYSGERLADEYGAEFSDAPNAPANRLASEKLNEGTKS